MQKFDGGAAYDLSLFDDSLVQPKSDEIFVQPPQIVKRTRKSKGQLKAEARQANSKATRVVVATCALLVAVGLLVAARAQLTEKSDLLATYENQYAVAQSENTRLNMELEARMSLDNVETYARDVLGMSKQERYQIEYIDLSGGNKLVMSENQKDKGFFESIGDKINSFLEYLF